MLIAAAKPRTGSASRKSERPERAGSPVRRFLMQPFSRGGRSVVDCRRELPLSLDSVLLDDGGERQVPNGAAARQERCPRLLSAAAATPQRSSSRQQPVKR